MAHIKTSEGYDVKIPNQGQVTYNSVAGSAGLASFLGLNAQNILGGLGWGNRNGCGCGTCSEDHLVTRYELGMEQALAAKDSEIALLKANTYNDQKSLELFRYIDSQIGAINARLAAQDVRNQGVADAIREVGKDIDYKVNLEAERRKCADCTIVNYVNQTFAPKLVTDYTAGTTSAVDQVYNPLACGGQCCGGNTFAGPAV